MAFLLDSTALSELTRERPNSGFLAWLETRTLDDMYVSSLSIAELALGIEMLPQSKKRTALGAWFTNLLEGFRDRILDFDVAAAQEWARLQAHARREHKPLPIIDCQIAATAVAHGFVIVTRNERHFQIPGFDRLRMLNPWT